jgi:hypothetical protein
MIDILSSISLVPATISILLVIRLNLGGKLQPTPKNLSDCGCIHYPPIKTVGQPATIDPPCAVKSPRRAAGRPFIITVADPFTIESGTPTQVIVSPTTDAGIFAINTVATPGPIIGPPTCGTGGTPGVTIGQVCISLILAAGIPIIFLF